jgi:hypothetical protein
MWATDQQIDQGGGTELEVYEALLVHAIVAIAIVIVLLLLAVACCSHVHIMWATDQQIDDSSQHINIIDLFTTKITTIVMIASHHYLAFDTRTCLKRLSFVFIILPCCCCILWFAALKWWEREWCSLWAEFTPDIKEPIRVSFGVISQNLLQIHISML